MRLITESELLAYNLGNEILNTFAKDCSDQHGLKMLTGGLFASSETLREQAFDAKCANNHAEWERLHRQYTLLADLCRTINRVVRLHDRNEDGSSRGVDDGEIATLPPYSC